ncbi:MAG: DUF2085 domain-containing protein [Ignavibacteriaceae bacterium]
MTLFKVNASSASSTNKIFLRVLFSFLLVIWILGFASLSIFQSSFAVIISPFLKKIYAAVCHQIDYKTINFFGQKLFVCSRCTGIYFGAFLSSFYLIFDSRKIGLKNSFLLAASILIIMDVVFYSIGLYEYSKSIAFITGLFFGSIVFVYILIIIEKFLFHFDEV